jgi:hypothetical protein
MLPSYRYVSVRAGGGGIAQSNRLNVQRQQARVSKERRVLALFLKEARAEQHKREGFHPENKLIH